MRKSFFTDIQFEVEHELYLARIERHYTGRDHVVKTKEAERLEATGLIIKEVIRHPEIEYYKTYPIDAVLVRFIPKYAAVAVAELPIKMNSEPVLSESAYTPLTEHLIKVGEHHDVDKLTALTQQAMRVANEISDPVRWKEAKQNKP